MITVSAPGSTNFTHTVRWYLMKKHKDTGNVPDEGDDVTVNFATPPGFPFSY